MNRIQPWLPRLQTAEIEIKSTDQSTNATLVFHRLTWKIISETKYLRWEHILLKIQEDESARIILRALTDNETNREMKTIVAEGTCTVIWHKKMRNKKFLSLTTNTVSNTCSLPPPCSIPCGYDNVCESEWNMRDPGNT